MLDINNFSLFVVFVFLLSITPGPDMAYVVGQSIANGRRAGVISAAGVALGSCTHALASVIGLTALIAASPFLFTVVKYAGAAYLVYLGLSLIRDSFKKQQAASGEQPDIKKNAGLYELLAKGFITTLTNPKVLLFFISFFPQFVAPGGEHYTASLIFLGVAYAVVAFLTDATFAILAGSAAGAFTRNEALQKVLDRVVGAVFIGLGIRLALVRS